MRWRGEPDVKPTTPRMALMGQRGGNERGKGKKEVVKKAGTEELEVQQAQKNKTMKIKILLLPDTTVFRDANL